MAHTMSLVLQFMLIPMSVHPQMNSNFIMHHFYIYVLALHGDIFMVLPSLSFELYFLGE